MKENLIKQYNDLNNSFKKILVFHLGISAGFFSEYNCMIFAMLYCLQHKIQFVLYSKDANFKYKDGWTDYFEPFCKSTSFWTHKYLNAKYFGPLNLSKLNFKDINNLKYQAKRFSHSIFAKISKIFVPYFYTQDLWNEFYNKEMVQQEYDIPELAIKGDFTHACNRLVEITWNYNAPTKKNIEELTNNCIVPDKYLSCHIRGGDKVIEYELLSVSDYIRAVKQYDYKSVFVLTDDYRIMSELQDRYPEYNYYTLCQEYEAGYDNSKFTQTDLELKKQSLLKLFASIEIMNKSEVFIGTKTSNPSIFMSMYNPGITKGIDCVNGKMEYLLD